MMVAPIIFLFRNENALEKAESITAIICRSKEFIPISNRLKDTNFQ